LVSFQERFSVMEFGLRRSSYQGRGLPPVTGAQDLLAEWKSPWGRRVPPSPKRRSNCEAFPG
jgi:hypothetical protein